MSIEQPFSLNFRYLDHPNITSDILEYIDAVIDNKMTDDEMIDFQYYVRRRNDNRIESNNFLTREHYPFCQLNNYKNLDHPNINFTLLNFIDEVILQPLSLLEKLRLKEIIQYRKFLKTDKCKEISKRLKFKLNIM